MTDTAAVARMARSAPAVGLEHVAAAADVDTATAVAALRGLRSRGGCAAATATALAARNPDGETSGLAVLAHRACPPPQRRIIAHDPRWLFEMRIVDLQTARGRLQRLLGENFSLPSSVAGSAGWIAREAPCVGGTRRTAALNAGSLSASERCWAASWPMPAAVAHHLMSDPSQDVRQRLALSAWVPAALLERFAKDRDADIRITAASNPRLGSETLRRLARDQQPGVRWAVAANPSSPPDALSVLVDSEEVWIAAAAKSQRRERSVRRLLGETAAASGWLRKLLRLRPPPNFLHEWWD